MSSPSVSPWGEKSTQFFFELTPDRVLDAVESAGFICTGRCFALNSFENRVYDIELDEEDPSGRRNLVAKFYRPGRWSREQILEEHGFLLELLESEIPVVAPLMFPGGETLQKTPEGIFFGLFPRVGGRCPDELEGERLEQVGRLLARIHNVGAVKEAPHRVQLGPHSYGQSNLAYLLEHRVIPMEWEDRYRNAASRLFEISEPKFQKAEVQRIHGDCHFGNLLWNEQGPFFLDFDDMVRGPCVQDIWLLVPGRDPENFARRERLLQAYEQMREFDRTTLGLVEALRALRFIHFTAWISRRWSDPVFPKAFPHFGTPKYWQEQVHDLEVQVQLLTEANQY